MAIKKVWNEKRDFEAVNLAEKWLAENGYSVGPMEGASPRAIKKGDFIISKWRGLSTKDKRQMDGQMIGEMRNGPVIIELKN